MSSSETVEQYFTRVTDLVNKMRVNGEDMPDSKVVEKILRIMPIKYDHVMTTILESHDMDTMTIAELQGTIESHINLVNKMRVYGEDMPDSKVVEKILCIMPRKYDHVVTTILESHDMDTMTIAELQGTMKSHISRILEKSEKRTEEAPKSRVNFNNVAETSCLSIEEEVKAIFIKKEPISIAFIVESMDTKQQIADSRCLVIVQRSLLKEKGHIPIKLKDGSLSYISDVFYAPEHDYNLLRMGQLSEKEYKMITYHGYCTVFDNNRRFIDKHMRFGHVHFSGLNYLSRKGLVSGLPRIHIPNCVCEICQLGKKHRCPFPTGKSWRARRLLEIVHSDLCYVEVPSNGGSKVAEGKNRTIMDMVRCMLKSKQMPKEFWAEAVATAVHILNRCPTKSVRDKTLEKAWSGKRPSIYHFRVFGCIAYAHVLDQLRKKLDDKAKKCIFIGYSIDSKAYKLYNLETKKVIISRDVTFDEKDMWEWDTKTEKHPIVISNTCDDEEERQPNATEQPESSRRPQRERRLPARLADYEVGNDNDPSDEEIIIFALFSDCEPLYFEETFKDNN
ncbi:uncharacterized protein [Arachis hypogaea]|uniref:uncharacterized protein n=1 Tax=Arachis hypogaea TaxID=3818 RepID=UPI003B22208A